MITRKAALGVIVFFTVIAVLTSIVFVTLQRSVSGSTDTYTAMFTDVTGLSVGDDVRVAGVRVGRVDNIELDGTVAAVRFEIATDQLLYGNTTVSVTYQNIIGQRYLGLSMGDHGDPRTLDEGSTIPIDRTEPSFDVSALLNGFEPLFSVLDPEQVDKITDAIITALQGDSGQLTYLIAQTATLTDTFAGPDDILGEVIDNLSSVTGTLAGQSDALAGVIANSGAIFDGLAQNRENTFAQIDTMSSTVDRLSVVAEGSTPVLSRFLGRQPGFSRHFLDEQDKFARLAFNLPMFLKSLSRITETGYATAYVCDVSTSIIPGLTNLIPDIVSASTPGGVAQHSPKCR